MSAIGTYNVEAELPTFDEARRLVMGEVKRAKREGVRVPLAVSLAIGNQPLPVEPTVFDSNLVAFPTAQQNPSQCHLVVGSASVAASSMRTS
jgi:hypothetical protein